MGVLFEQESSTPSSGRAGYDPKFYAELASVEDKHFWFQARNLLVSLLTGQLTRFLRPGYRVLEIGCGNGNVLRTLSRVCRQGIVVGFDLFLEGLLLASRRTNCALVQGDIRFPPFGAPFDIVCMLDVLEHIRDDRAALSRAWELVVPGGVILITVPARASLWSYFDVVSGHVRRYEERELHDKLRNAGFSVEFTSPYLATIYPLVWLSRRWQELRCRRGPLDSKQQHDLARQQLRIVPVLNSVLTSWLELEVRLVASRRRLPLGASLIAVARKPAEPPLIS